MAIRDQKVIKLYSGDELHARLRILYMRERRRSKYGKGNETFSAYLVRILENYIDSRSLIDDMNNASNIDFE